jgi:hypothetical protein
VRLFPSSPARSRAADREVQHTVRACRDRTVGVLPGVGKVGDDSPELAHAPIALQVGGVDIFDRHQVDLPTRNRDSVHPGSPGDDARLIGAPVTVRIAQEQKVALVAPGDVHAAIIAGREHPRAAKTAGEDGHLESLRHVKVTRPGLIRSCRSGLIDVALHRDVGGPGIGEPGGRA